MRIRNQTNVASAASRRRSGSESCRASHGACDHRDITAAVFVIVGPRPAQTRTLDFGEEALSLDADVRDDDPPHVAGRRLQEVRRLQRLEGDRQVEIRNRRKDLAIVGSHAARHVYRDACLRLRGKFATA